MSSVHQIFVIFAHIAFGVLSFIMHNYPKRILTVNTLNTNPVKSAASDAGSA